MSRLGPTGLTQLLTNIKTWVTTKLGNYVTTDTTQTITGKKLFTNAAIQLDSLVSMSGSTMFINTSAAAPRGAWPAEAHRVGRIYIGDNASYNGAWFIVDPTIDTNKAYYRMVTTNPDNTDSTRFSITWDSTETGARCRKNVSRGDLLPSGNNTYNLGADDLRWDSAYVTNLYINGTQFVPSDVMHLAGSETVTGTKIFNGDKIVITQGNGYRMVCNGDGGSSGYGVFQRVDSANWYLMVTAQDDALGTWTSARPASMNLSTGVLNINGKANEANKVQATIAAGATTALVQATVASNDCFRIAAGGAANAGWAEIATGDDANKPIYVRQYKGNFTTLQRTATLLDGSGNTSFPGQVTGNKFDGPLTWSGTAFSYNAGNSLYYYSGQPAIANCFEGSSNDFTKFSYPTGGTFVSSSNANIQTLRLDWGNTYWHDLFMSPNNNYLWHRNVVNSDARGWRRIVEENVTGLTDQSWNINIAGTAANVTGTVDIANGGTGATTRLNAVKNLTNESVGTPTHFLAITTNYAKAGYTTVAQAKTVLGITGDIVSHNASEFLTSHQSLSSCVKNVVTNSQIIKSTGITRGTAPSSTQTFGIPFTDNNGTYIGNVYGQYATDKSTYVGLYAYKGTTTSNSDNAGIQIGYDASGNVYTSAPTPASLDNSTKIATTAFVYNTAVKHLAAATNIYVAKVATGNGSGSNTSNYMSLADLRTYLATVHMHSSTSDMNGSYNLQILFKAGDSFGNATFDATKMPGVRNLILNTSTGTNSTVDNYSTNSPTFGNIVVTGDISVTMRNLNCTGRIYSQYGAYVSIDTYMGISSLQAVNYGYLNVAKNMVINVCDAHTDYLFSAMNNGILSMWPGATVTINFRQQCYYTRSLFYAASNGTAWIGYSSFKLTGTEPMAVWGSSGTLTGTSETAAATVEKAVTLASGQTFTLTTNATAKVKFTVDNTANNPTLNIGGTGAKPIYWNNAPVQATMLMKNITYDVKYNGSQFVIQNAVKRLTNNDFGVFRSSGNYNQTYNSGSWNFTGWALYYGTGIENSNWRGNHIGNIQQNVSTSNNTFPVLISGTANATANTLTVPYFAKGVKINPSTSTITATTFSGALTGNVTGNCSGSSGSCTGNAATATTAGNVTGTVAIANGGTGATTRLNAVKNLTNESVGTPTHFLAITTNYAKAGYTTVAQAKTVLGITGDMGSHSDSEYVHKTGDESITGTKTFGNGTLIVDNGTGSNVHGEIKLDGTRPVYINADNAEDGLFANTSCGMSILLNDSSKAIHIGGITTGANGRKIIKTSEKVPYLTLGTQEVMTKILVPENDTADSTFSITSRLDYASGASAKSFTVRFKQGDDGSSSVFPVANNKTDLGLSNSKWKGVYATNFYENGTALSSKYALNENFGKGTTTWLYIKATDFPTGSGSSASIQYNDAVDGTKLYVWLGVCGSSSILSINLTAAQVTNSSGQVWRYLGPTTYAVGLGNYGANPSGILGLFRRES